jgi:hypothetical protein
VAWDTALAAVDFGHDDAEVFNIIEDGYRGLPETVPALHVPHFYLFEVLVRGFMVAYNAYVTEEGKNYVPYVSPGWEE